MHIVINSY